MNGILHQSPSGDNTHLSAHLDLGTLQVVPDSTTNPVELAEARAARGVALARAGAVRRLSGRRFSVTGSRGVAYILRPVADGDREHLACSCPDYAFRRAALGATCAHIVAVSAYFASRWSEPEPEPPAAVVAVPFTPAPGVHALARLHGRDVHVELGARNPNTKYGQGFFARDLATGRTITVPSPGNLRPVPAPATAAPMSRREAEPGESLVRFALRHVESLKLSGLVHVEEVDGGVELLANGYREHELFEPVPCSSNAEVASALEVVRDRLRRTPTVDVPPDSRLCPEMTWHKLSGR